MGEQRVQHHLAEARAHAEATGRTLAQEFGSPSSYASRFVKDRRAETKRRVWFYAAIALLALVLAISEVAAQGWDWSLVSWPFVAIFVLAAGPAAKGWWRVTRERAKRP